MEFSKSDYGFVGIFLPVATFLVIIMGAFFVSKYLASKKYHWRTIIFAWVIVLVLLLHGLSTYSYGFTYPISAALQTDAVQYITVGSVEQVQSAPCPPIYFNPISGKFSPAKFISVDGVRFYMPYCDIEIGQTVELRWATGEHVVYAYRILSDEEIYESCTYPIAPPNPSHQHNSSTQVGLTLAIVSAILLALAVALQYPLGKAMSPYFAKKDRDVRDIIHPNRFGLLYVCTQLFLMCGILGGLALRGFGGVIIVFLIGAVFIGRLVLKKQTTTAFLEGDLLIVKDWETEYRIERDSVKTIEFVASRLPYNRCLMLTLENGMVFRFEQENFYGLESMYAKLSNLPKQKPRRT